MPARFSAADNEAIRGPCSTSHQIHHSSSDNQPFVWVETILFSFISVPSLGPLETLWSENTPVFGLPYVTLHGFRVGQ